MRSTRLALVATAAVTLASTAIAVPRDSSTFTDQEVIVPTSGIYNLVGPTQTAAYTTRFVRVQGTLTASNVSTKPSESMVWLGPPGFPFSAPPFAFSVSTSRTAYLGTPRTIDQFYRLPNPSANAAGSWWYIAFIATNQTTDNQQQAVWNTVTVTLNDGPPPATNLGPLTPGAVTKVTPMVSSTTRWYRFDNPTSVVSPAYLDIDTFGTAIGASNGENDTELVMYDENGKIVASNGDVFTYGLSGPVPGFRLSMLSFGAGGGATPITGLNASGQSGTLPAGTYWIALKGNGPSSQNSVGWDVVNTSTLTGTGTLNIRTNVGESAWCPGDFSRNDVVTIDDVFIYLNAWFANCP